MDEKEKFTLFSEDVISLLNNNTKLLLLELIDRLTILSAVLILSSVLLLIGFVMLVFISISLSIYLSLLIGNSYIGFLIIAGVYFILLLLIYLTRKKIFYQAIKNKLVYLIFKYN